MICEHEWIVTAKDWVTVNCLKCGHGITGGNPDNPDYPLPRRMNIGEINDFQA